MLVSYGTGSWKASKVMAVGMPVFMADGICNGIQNLNLEVQKSQVVCILEIIELAVGMLEGLRHTGNWSASN